ncbi:MAG: aminotransferase DegT [Porticoccaceae bacterium]|nr:aminotransferase DegT [Porticoccaceae bacterium]
MQFIDLAAQYRHLKSRIDSRIERVLSHGQYIMGPEVLEFESLLADYIGVKHCISCANGTDALSLCLMALDCKEGDAVFCPSFTFFATAETIAYQKATPVFVDSDSKLFNICPTDLESQIKKVIKNRQLIPKAIIAVDLFGLPANYPEIEALASKYSLGLIEDAAQGLGGEIRGKKAGSFGDIAATSFFPAKPLGCYGDGGAVLTNNDHYAELLKSLRVHGKGVDKYDNIRIGMNSRLDTIQAAILIEKLAEFPEELHARNIHAEKYSKLYSGLFEIPEVPEGYKSSWAQYTLKADNRDIAISGFTAKGIPTAIYYKNCLHQQIAFEYLNYTDADLPVASTLAKQVFSLPMHAYL